MNKKTRYIALLSVTAMLLSSACSHYLDAVPDRSLAILTTVAEYQQLLDNPELYQTAPTIQEYGSDDFYVSDATWPSMQPLMQNPYVWESDIYGGGGISTQDWWAAYSAIYYANVVLEGAASIQVATDPVALANLKGHALFLRAYQHLLVQEVYGQPYRPATAGTDLGVPLKLNANVDEPIQRATTGQTFTQIVRDLREALALVSGEYPEANRQRVSKAAVYAALARVYLIMQDYPNALKAADESISRYGTLLDFASLAPANRFPFPDNPEVLFTIRRLGHGGFLASASAIIDSTLYDSYGEHDLRTVVYFRINPSNGTPYVNSLYSGSASPFGGLATDEVYLTRAECRARLGDGEAAIDDLNHLLRHRFTENRFAPMVAADTPDILGVVFAERRKQLLFRGMRWTDLRRLNQDPQRAVTLRRVINGTEYTLPPNSPKYAFPIPPEEISLSNLVQNER